MTTPTPVVFIARNGHLVTRHASQDDALSAAVLLACEFAKDGLPIRVSVIDGLDRNFLRPICFLKATA